MKIIPVLFLGYILCSCGNDDKGTPMIRYSRSIQESKNNGVFEFEVIPYKSNLTLDSEHTLKINNAWVENVWSTQNHFIGKAVTQKDTFFHQLMLSYDIVVKSSQPHDTLYYFVGRKPKEDGLVLYNCDRIDTIRVPLFREKSPHLPPLQKRKAFDSLTFVRKY